jgi:hypothetical protein
VTANLAQPQQRPENMKALLVELTVGLEAEDELARTFEFGVVKGFLLAFHFTQQILLHAVGQILFHLRLGAAQQKRPHARGEAAAGKGIVLAVEAAEKMRLIAQRAGHGKCEDAPQIEQAVFNRRAGQREAMLGLQHAGGLRGLRTWILNVLCFIQNCRQPGHTCDLGRKVAQLRIVDDQQVAGFARSGKLRARFAAPQADAQVGIKPLGFGVPIVHDGLGADDQRRVGSWGLSIAVCFPQPGQPGQRFEGFAQAHVVGQHAAETVQRQVSKKMKTFGLIRPHFGADGRGQRRRDARFQFARAAPDGFNPLWSKKFFHGIVGQLQGVESLRFGGEIARVEAEPGELFVVVRRETELQPPPALFF